MASRQSRQQQFIDLIAADLPVDDEYTRPDPREPGLPLEAWMPPLGPIGTQAFLCDAKFMLLHGPRFSGKTWAGLHRVVRGLYDNRNASACLATLTRSQAIVGGLWTKFQMVLQLWSVGAEINGKWYDGFGLEGTGKNGELEWKQDDARNRYVMLKNVAGEWSMAFLRSMMHGEQIEDRIKSMEFSTFLYDELSNTDDENYFTKPINQLRIPGVYPQQFIGCCNPPPEGEDHWVHKRWFQGFDNPKDKHPKRREDYKEIFFPLSDNLFVSDDLKESILSNIAEDARNDPTSWDRMADGKWVKRPTGKGLFAPYFRTGLHVLGNARTQQFIIPGGSVINIGYDIGTANSAITFEERINTQKGEMWSWFDEIVLVEKYIPIPQVAPILLKLMNYWCGRTGRPLFFNHIADSGSFDQMRPDGTYDARKLEEAVRDILSKTPEQYPHLDHIKSIRLRACPKPPGSKAARARMLIARLQAELLIVSARCVKHIEMLENIPEDPNKPYHALETSRHRHAFDSSTYVIYHYEMGGRGGVPQVGAGTNFVELHP